MPLPFLGLLAGGIGRSLLMGSARGGLSGSMAMRSQAGGSGGGGLLQNLMASSGGGEAPESQGLTGTAKRDFFALGKEMTNKFEGNDKQRQDQREANTKGPKPMMKILGQMAGKAKGIAGLNISMAAFARSSSLFQSSMGAFNQVMGSYADMFFAPFAPYVFKFVGFLASGIEGFGKMWSFIVKWNIFLYKITQMFNPMRFVLKLILDNWDAIWGFISKPFEGLGNWLTKQTWWTPLISLMSDPTSFIYDVLTNIDLSSLWKKLDWSTLWTGLGQSDWVLNIMTLIGNILESLRLKGLAEGVKNYVGVQEVMKATNLTMAQADFLVNSPPPKNQSIYGTEFEFGGWGTGGSGDPAIDIHNRSVAQSNDISVSRVLSDVTDIAENVSNTAVTGAIGFASTAAKTIKGILNFDSLWGHD